VAKRILIADDSVTIQKAFAMTFLGEDVSLTAARSADEAFALAQKARPDLIIADGAMPGRTGYDLCAQVRADAALRNIPVYILASGQQPYDDARGSKAGADGHLTKPWDTALFLQQVTAAANAPQTPRRITAPSMPTAPPIAPAPQDDDGDYGEISIDGSGSAPTPAPVMTAPAPVPRMPTPALPSAPLTMPPGMRPSLIPGLRPGTVPPAAARPGTSPVRTMAPAAAPAPPRPVAPPTAGRTMIGLPAAGAPLPGVTRPPGTGTAPMAPIAPAMRAPFAPAPPPAVVPFAPPAPPPRARSMTPTPPPAPLPRARVMTPSPPPPVAPAVASPALPASAPLPPSPLGQSQLAQSIDQKLAAIGAKGPEYEAIAKLSREVIEQVVWEIVPELAEAIIRDHLQKSGRI